VLHLEARVHLQEVEGAVLAHHELHRARVRVAGRFRERDRGVSDPRARLLVDDRRGRLLDQLLVPALDRAVALAEEPDVAALVGEDLRLHVVGVLDVALHEDLGAAEVRAGLALGAFQR
jgi:hypothetical protein